MTSSIPLTIVDAFTTSVFHGNPAAVCILGGWLPDHAMRAVAAEHNLSETAFLIGGDGRYDLRWFTPEVEMDLCGHATLASAHVVMTEHDPQRDTVVFDTKSGPLTVTRGEGGRLVLDFPARPATPGAAPAGLASALGATPAEVHHARDVLAVFPAEADVRGLAPDFRSLAAIDAHGVIATAPGEDADVDFVSRFFAPAVGVDEDPVTGSAHCTLVPYWAERLGRDVLRARQISRRGGELWCERAGDRVRIAGHAVTYARGAIVAPVSAGAVV